MKIVDASADRRLLTVMTPEGKRETIHVSPALAEELVGIIDLLGREVDLVEVAPHYTTWKLRQVRGDWVEVAAALGLVGLGVIFLISVIAVVLNY